MSSKTQNVSHFVEYRLKRIVNSSSDGAVKASFGKLAQGNRDSPGRYSGALGTVFHRIYPRNVKQKRCSNACTMGCLYCTDAVCASSTGQRFAKVNPTYRQGNTLGKAVAGSRHNW